MQILKDLGLGTWVMLKRCKDTLFSIAFCVVFLGIVWGMSVSPVFAAICLITLGLFVVGVVLFGLWSIGKDERKRREPVDRHEYLDYMGK
jgi:cbb3-type cytochrome oxidase subunit 3